MSQQDELSNAQPSNATCPECAGEMYECRSPLTIGDRLLPMLVTFCLSCGLVLSHDNTAPAETRFRSRYIN